MHFSIFQISLFHPNKINKVCFLLSLMNLERQIRYNFKTDTGEQINQRHKWTFLIINQPFEISRIEQRILNVLAPCSEKEDLAKGLIEKTNGLHYQAFNISSDKGELKFWDKNEIYRVEARRFKQDRNLREDIEKPEIWFGNYVFKLK